VIDANSGFFASAWAGRAHDIGDKDGKAVMAAAGNEIATLSEGETARIQALGDTVIENWIAEVTSKGLDGATLVEDASAAVTVTRDVSGREY